MDLRPVWAGLLPVFGILFPTYGYRRVTVMDFCQNCKKETQHNSTEDFDQCLECGNAILTYKGQLTEDFINLFNSPSPYIGSFYFDKETKTWFPITVED